MTQRTTQPTWHERAPSLRLETGAFIDNEYVESASGRHFDAVSPIDGASLAAVAECDARDVDRAVESANRALSGPWSRLAPSERKELLSAFADGIEHAREELALATALEVGKPIRAALDEVDAAARCIAYYAEALDKVFGEVAPTGPDTLALVTRQPIGVVGAVVPWNYPIKIVAWKIGPALAAGNCVVLKPAEQSPLGALLLGRIARGAGLPAGVLNIVPGAGTVGAAIGRHPDVGKVTFTGSTQVGKLFLGYAAESNMKAVSLECGGKSPNIVMADANLDAAARAAAEAFCSNSGQMCSAGSRLLVARSCQQRLLQHLDEALERWRPGDPLDPGTRMGPLIDRQQLDRVLSYIEIGRAEGAVVRRGGSHPDERGLYVEPTVFEDVDNRSRLAQEEVFGPVLAMVSFDTEDEAVALANDTSYGLAAAVWTEDSRQAHRVAQALRAGSVYVNCYDPGAMSVPFGGWNESGIDVDLSLHALEKYTRLKATWWDLAG